MNRMTGTIFMVIGLLTFIIGLIVFLNSNRKKEETPNLNNLEKAIEMAIADGVLTDNERKIIKQIAVEKELDYNEIISGIENQILDSNTDSETEVIDYNKKNGDDFEKFVVQKFDKKYFTIKEWAGDKYVNGVYAQTTLQPDILFEFKFKNQTVELSVECKWRSKYYPKGIEFASLNQFKRYQDFERSRNIPVFIAIGVGGKGKRPEQFYIIPLKSIESNFISTDKLKDYEKRSDSDFFFDLKTKELK